MQNVLLVIHLVIAVAMILLILIQRNAQDGGGLMGGGGTMGGIFTARGSANALTRTTAFLAVAFVITSLLLTLLANQGNRHERSLVNQIPDMPKAGPLEAGKEPEPEAQPNNKEAKPEGENAVTVAPKVPAPPQPMQSVPKPMPEKPVPAVPMAQ